ncbi:hypothetical protein J3R82DRAFT_5172 [Butyriboletus roseoflavus]|nr:hypothetical protein J3R82DRAFT_5172 [Butyriboletus roseoflavus]
MPICLSCGVSFGSCKQLSAHSALYTDDIALSTAVYEHKHKPSCSESGNHEGKRSHSSPPSISHAPKSLIAEQSVHSQDDTFECEDFASNHELPPPIGKFACHLISRTICQAVQPILHTCCSQHINNVPYTLVNPMFPLVLQVLLKAKTPRSSSPPHSIPFTTEPDSFGLYCIYPSKPTYNPPHSLENASWNYSGSHLKSGIKANRFARLQQNPQYKTEELKKFSFTCKTKQLDDFLDSKANPFHSDYGWCKSTIEIKLPRHNVPSPSEFDAPQMKINGIWHHDIVNIITNTFQSETGLLFNMTPFSQ